MSGHVFVLHSEKFMVRLNKNGGPKNPEKVDRLCALFTVTHTQIKAQREDTLPPVVL